MSLFGGIELPNRPDPENVRKLDLLPIPMVRQMVRFGMRIDPPHFAALSSRFQDRMRELRHDITDVIPAAALDQIVGEPDDSADDEPGDVPPEFNVESSQKVAALLYDVLGLHLKGVKVKKTKGGDRFSTGKKTLEQLKREHPVVPLILEYRECSKLDGTYAKAMPRQARFHPKGEDCPVCGRHHYTDEYRVHTQLLTTRTATGRMASKAPNLSNVPTRTKVGAEIRAGFIASDGHVIAQRDWAQFELRILGHRCGDETMLRVYREDGDIHTETAMRAFGLSDPSQVDKMLHRAPCKNVNFGVAYGLGEDGLLDLMAVTYATAGKPLPEYIDKAWCAGFIEKWFSLYPAARRYFDAEESNARRFAAVWTACGRVRRIPEVRSCHPWIQEAGVRQAGNHGIQGDNADCMKLAMGELMGKFKVLGEYEISTFSLMSIYDELLVETTEEHGETVEAVMEDVMDNCLVDKDSGRCHSRVPIKSDGKIMKRWVKE